MVDFLSVKFCLRWLKNSPWGTCKFFANYTKIELFVYFFKTEERRLANWLFKIASVII